MSAISMPTEHGESSPLLALTRLLSQHWKWEAIRVAARLHIAEALADGSLSVEQLAKITGTHSASLHRLLRALACIGVFAELDESRFVNTKLSELLRPNVPGSFSGMAQVNRDLMLRPWGELLYSVQTGEPGFDKAFGVSMWRYFAECDTSAGALFNEGMASFSAAVDAPIAEAAELSGVGTVVDVGGGRGSLLTTVLTAYPSIKKGILFDQPSVIEEARSLLSAAGDERMELVGGDFFTAVPAGADVYIMRWILHDWNDTACINLLTTCRHAMLPHSRLLSAELIIDTDRNDELAHSYDLQMLVLFGSKERTLEEFKALYDSAGLRLTRVIPTASNFSLLEGVPAG
jgi:hypothetical protein